MKTFTDLQKGLKEPQGSKPISWSKQTTRVLGKLFQPLEASQLSLSPLIRKTRPLPIL